MTLSATRQIVEIGDRGTNLDEKEWSALLKLSTLVTAMIVTL